MPECDCVRLQPLRRDEDQGIALNVLATGARLIVLSREGPSLERGDEWGKCAGTRN